MEKDEFRDSNVHTLEKAYLYELKNKNKNQTARKRRGGNKIKDGLQ